MKKPASSSLSSSSLLLLQSRPSSSSLVSLEGEEEKNIFHHTQKSKTTSTSTTTSTHVVSFASTVSFHETLHRKDFSKEEKVAYWYNKKELLSIKREAKKCSVELVSLLSSPASPSPSSPPLEMTMTIDDDNKELFDSADTTATTTTVSLLMRGLEAFTPDGYSKRKHNRGKSWTVVFDEQYAQEEEAEDNDDDASKFSKYDLEAIALLYSKQTKHCQEEALRLGKLDEAWVMFEEQQKQKQ